MLDLISKKTENAMNMMSAFKRREAKKSDSFMRSDSGSSIRSVNRILEKQVRA